MQLRWFYLPAALLSVVLCSCQSTGGGGSGPGAITGPFDSRGNYVEAWADTPSKWRKSGGSTEIADAQPDREAANVPVVPEPVAPPVLAANERPKPISTKTTRVYKKPDGTTVPAKPKSGSTAGTSSKSKSKPVVVKPKTTPKKEVAKSKAKPKSSRHTVRSGDSLYSIAKRYGTTASAVQKANGLKSTVIRPGQTLTIPK